MFRFVILLAALMVAAGSYAEIIYMKGSVYEGVHPGQSGPGALTVLHLNIDSQLPSELREDSEFYYDTNLPNPKIIGEGGYLSGAWDLPKNTAEIENWYYIHSPQVGYHALRFQSDGTSGNAYRYGWLHWDGTTFDEYAFNSVLDEHIEIGAIPEPSSAILIAVISGIGLFVRRRFPCV